MDILSDKLLQELAKYWYIIPIFIGLAILKTARFKGIFGEFLVNLMARIRLDKDTYHVIKNVTLPTGNGTTQIDHIIVSVYGIFVVETKNMKGWIFGGETQKTWTQKIYKYSQKFQNPLHQNYKHVKTLQTLLNLSDNQLYSVIVFVGDSTFKTAMPNNVTYGMGYIRYIKSKTEILFFKTQVEAFIEQIETGRYPTTLATHRQHIKNVNTLKSEKQNKPLCPKCGSEMILRTAKRGQNQGKQFWGCSQFPRCRGVRQTEKISY